MSQTVDFDQSASNALEAAYLTTDVKEQRANTLRALALERGQSVLDIGAGPGLLAWELANAVGPEGSVQGLDLSEPMLEMARRRCAQQPHVSFDLGDAGKLPYEDDRFDAVVSTQVFEYIADIPGALAGVARVLRPGGIVAILDTDYDSLVLHTEDPERHQRILDAWDEHFVHRGLPRTLGPALREAAGNAGEKLRRLVG